MIKFTFEVAYCRRWIEFKVGVGKSITWCHLLQVGILLIEVFEISSYRVF